MESDKRIRVAKNRKNPARAYKLGGVFRAVFILCPAASVASTAQAKAPPHIQRGGAPGYYCAGSLMRVYSFCRSSQDAGSKSTAPTGTR